MTFIAAIILGIVALGFLFHAFVINARPENQRQNAARSRSFLVGLASAAVAVALGIAATFTIVDVSKTGVVTSMGKLQTKTLSEGPHLVLPWESVRMVSNASMSITSPDKMVFYTKNNQKVFARISAQVQVRDVDSRALFQLNPSLNYMEQFVTPALLESFKYSVGQYQAEDLNTKLNALNVTMLEQMREKLKSRHIQVISVNVLDWSFTPEFSKSVEDKEIENQNVAKAEFVKQRAQKEADAQFIRAQGEAKSIREVTSAINAQGGENFVKLREIERWNGSKATTIIGGNAAPIVSIPADKNPVK